MQECDDSDGLHTSSAEEEELLSTIWSVCIGTKEFPGDVLVDMILNRVKQVKYLSFRAANCFQVWILLKEIKTNDKSRLGTVRCAIQLHPCPLEKNSDNYKPEWGWVNGSSSVGYKIMYVRQFHPRLLSFSNQGIPFQLQKCLEVDQFRDAIAHGIEKTDERKHRQRDMSFSQREIFRKAQRNARKAQRDKIAVFEQGDGEWICCKHNRCSEKYCVTPGDSAGVPIFQFLRRKYHKLSCESRRIFMKARISERFNDGHISKEVFLESYEVLQSYLNDRNLLLYPRNPKKLQKVCVTFWLWALNCSHNKLYQHYNGFIGSPFSLELRGYRSRPDPHNCLIATKIKEWILDLSLYALYDPSEPLIFIQWPSRKAVWDLYCQEALDPDKSHFFVWDQNQKVKLPTCTYFRFIWSNSPELSHIRLRKHAKFAICDDCKVFMELRKRSKSFAELKLIIAMEKKTS